MAENPRPEIPQEMRELALQNIDQARKAREMIKTMVPSNPMAAGLNEVQERVMRFAQQNLDASFAMANELAKAKGLMEALQIQSRHTQLQMHAFSLQAEELWSLMNEAAQKAKLGS
jgi:hypothetical protein